VKQAQYLEVIDEFSDAVYDLADGAPIVKSKRVKKALGDVITMLASQATAQSLGAFGVLLAKLEKLEARIAVDEERLHDLEERTLETREAGG
jgi:hypothetical protein